MEKYCVGYLQFDVTPGNIDANLSAVKNGLSKLSPNEPGVIVLPELWATGFNYMDLPLVPNDFKRLLASLQDLATKYNIYLAGSLPEQSGNGSMYNTFFVTNPAGSVDVYRKQHLFVPIAEDNFFHPGTRPNSFLTPFGLWGFLVCFDLRFPEVARMQVIQGAELLLVCAQWPLSRIFHWRVLLQARAIENQMYVAACNCCGQIDNEWFGGHSLIVAPDGTILAEAGEGTGSAWVEIDRGFIREVRGRFNSVTPRTYE